ncbi:hypothetical protein ACLQ24_27875 [Micromonospora sp. DT4]|uniref:hypothetical protein n=1 Tax=Micromonospora sp. DT4 TaxID=3393438 RepID=UPI003CF5E03B
MSFATAPRWIIHLPTTLTSLDEATALAVALCDSLGHLTVVDFGETTLSEEDAQFLRTRVFCDARLGGAGRCRRPDAHDGPCGQVPHRERRRHPDLPPDGQEERRGPRGGPGTGADRLT